MKKIIESKRGSIPVMILVIGVFAVCTLAMFTFLNSNVQARDSFQGLKLLGEMNSQIEEYEFYKMQGKTDEEIKEMLKLQEQGIFKTRSVEEVKNLVAGFIREKKINPACEIYVDIIMKAAGKQDISDPLLLVFLMNQESSCNKLASSETAEFSFEQGASYGIMQISGRDVCGKKEYFLKDYSDAELCKNKLMEDYESNILLGAKILSEKFKDYKRGCKESSYYKTKNTKLYSTLIDGCNNCENTEGKSYFSYREEEAALRAYNGWGCGANADIDFVEHVLKNFPEWDSKNIYAEKTKTKIKPSWDFNWIKQENLISIIYELPKDD